jgi:hypothetical protein
MCVASVIFINFLQVHPMFNQTFEILMHKPLVPATSPSQDQVWAQSEEIIFII